MLFLACGVSPTCRSVGRHKGGTPRDLYWAGAALFYDLAGKVAGAVLIVLEDVTDRLATEQMLRQAQKMEAVGQLTGGVAHDFNNILTVILANVEELLEDGKLSADQREMLAAISASGDRAAELTRRLLAFSRQQRLLPQPTDLDRPGRRDRQAAAADAWDRDRG